MDVDDILNESDDSSTSKEDESEPSQNEKGQEEEAEVEAEEVKAPFALEGEDFPPAADTNSVEVE